MPSKEVRLSAQQARAYWAERQGISRPIQGGVADAVRASGWVYSAGSTLPYLAIRARLPGCDRAAVDRAVFEDEDLIEVPTVRGCSMLVPAEEVSLALVGGQRFSAQYQKKVKAGCNIKEREIADLCAAVQNRLKDGPTSLEFLRSRLPADLVRDLGAAGKRLGERSTLTFAMRMLQRQMVVQRVAADRRLDSQSFSYRLFPHDLRKNLSLEEADSGLARRFFAWAGPATAGEFAWWAGMSQKDARAAINKIGLVQVSIEDWAQETWVPAEHMDRLRATRSKDGHANLILLPFRDNYLYFRRGIGVFLDEEDRTTEVLDWMRRPAVLGDLDSLHHNAIVAGGKLIGYWEYDPGGEEVVWRACSRLDPASQRKLESAIEQLQNFIRSQLGDVAFYAFDSGKNRRQRIDSLR